MNVFDRIYFGGDYNPDQWEEETLDRDMEMFQRARINLLTLPVFSWAQLEPDEGEYHFEWLDRILDKIWEHGIFVCLATPTCAQPAWMSTRYPEVLPVDIQGRKRTHGMRVSFCVNSLKYRERARAIAEEMAKRYAGHPAVVMWHVANEYGTYCYCEKCQAKFRVWLKKRYKSIETLNKKWNTAFWGRTASSFEEIVLPSRLNDDDRYHQAASLDYMRFVTDCTAECFLNEYEAIRKYDPKRPVTTNMSGYIKKLDQFVFVKNLDVTGWDNYPFLEDPLYLTAMKHDLMRGLKGGQSFVLMEQSPNQQNWQPYNRLKRPGEVRRLSYQAMGRGADTCLFFQMKQSVAGQEKFHGAIISHSGREDTRVFRETQRLGCELERLGNIFIGARTPARAAIIFDWNNWWALELSSGPTKDMDYLKLVASYYETLFRQNIAVDMVPYDGCLDSYSLVIAPYLYMMRKKTAEKLEKFVEAGGILVTTVMSGLADENDRCVFGAYPGLLGNLLGIWVEETDALRPFEKNHLILQGTHGMKKEKYECGFLCDVIHPEEETSVLAVYGDDFYRGGAAVTCSRRGRGRAYYIGTQPEQCFLDELMEKICRNAGIKAPYEAQEGVELTWRQSEKGDVFFAINHTGEKASVDFKTDFLQDPFTKEMLTGKMEIPAGEVLLAYRSVEDKERS